MPVVLYEEVKDLPNHPEKLLIDVRNEDEIMETGLIPCSINIPLSEIERAFTLPDEYFVKQYGRSKPDLTDELIFSCRSGRRSQLAIDMVTVLGYKNVKNYKGSWLEWEEREGLSKNN